MERYVDLHVHTNYSDGSLSPEEVVACAKKCGLAAIGIADHDEVAGITEAVWRGHSHGLEIVPAVEITSGCDGKEIHLLGYMINHNHRDLRERLKHFRYDRFKRMEKMVRKLKGLGFNIYMESVRRIAGRGSLGRLHLARALFQEGIVGNVQEAFDLYIGRGKPAYEEKPRVEVSDAFQLITDAGGIPVLAHPKLVHVDKVIPELVRLGLQGIEVFYSRHTPEDIGRYLAIAERHKLLVTGGSDCHGLIKDSMLLGTIKLPYHYLTALREHARQE
jgi:hypothetical protein